jgi:hypothetical protein
MGAFGLFDERSYGGRTGESPLGLLSVLSSPLGAVHGNGPRTVTLDSSTDPVERP